MQFIIITTAKDRDGQNNVNTSKSKVSFFYIPKSPFFLSLPSCVLYKYILIQFVYIAFRSFWFKSACSRSMCVCVCVSFSLFFYTDFFDRPSNKREAQIFTLPWSKRASGSS